MSLAVSVKAHIEELRKLTCSCANGEFIAASEGVEIHVFLQQGRIAWGTTSSKRFGFMQHLFATCQIDRAAFREVIDACRQQKQPVGETLVQWGLASVDQVRGALESQVVESLRDLLAIGSAQTLFLRRESYSEYSPSMTFVLEDLLAKASLDGGAEALEVVAADAGDHELVALGEKLVSALPEALWVEIFDPDKGVVGGEHGLGRPVAEVLAPRTIHDGAVDFVAIRAGLGTVVGSLVPGTPRSIWCGLGAGSTIGKVMAALASVVGTGHVIEAAPVSAGHFRRVGQNAPHERLLEVAVKTQGLTRAVVFSVDEGDEWGLVREGLELAPALAMARERITLLHLDAVAGSLRSGAPLDSASLGYDFGSMVLAEASSWSFTAELPQHPGKYLWLTLDRNQSQGMGWALLTSLVRRLAA